jgi:anti-anti-sigma factor
MASYSLEHESKDCRIYIEGGLTASLVPELQRTLRQELSNEASVVFDLTRADFVDSTGIGLLIATCNSLSRQNGTIRVVNAKPEILALLRSMRLVSRLNVSGLEGSE